VKYDPETKLKYFCFCYIFCLTRANYLMSLTASHKRIFTTLLIHVVGDGLLQLKKRLYFYSGI